MKVSQQYALEHFDEVASAVDSGEVVEIDRVGKPALHLVRPTPTRQPPRADQRVLGAGKALFPVPTEAEWAAMDRELEADMNGPILPEAFRSTNVG